MERALPAGAWPNWVVGNHDEQRIATRLGGIDQARAMAVLLLTLRGTPTIYYGDEIGMIELAIPAERQQDPYGRRVPGYGRDGCRTPMQWDSSEGAGFSTAASTWLPINPNHQTVNVDSQLGDPDSTLELYRALLRLRRAEPALHRGEVELLDLDLPLLGFRRVDPDGRRFLIAANLSHESYPFEQLGEKLISSRSLAESDPASLGPWEAVVTRPVGLSRTPPYHSPVLDRILDATRERVIDLRSRRAAVMARAEEMPTPASFRGALQSLDRLGVIAEIKRRSPSRGELAPDLDVVSLAGGLRPRGGGRHLGPHRAGLLRW